jgi:hypothetical protein
LLIDVEDEHRMRNYLAAVITLCGLVRDEPVSRGIEADIAEIETSARSALAILDAASRRG